MDGEGAVGGGGWGGGGGGLCVFFRGGGWGGGWGGWGGVWCGGGGGGGCGGGGCGFGWGWGGWGEGGGGGGFYFTASPPPVPRLENHDLRTPGDAPRHPVICGNEYHLNEHWNDMPAPSAALKSANRPAAPKEAHRTRRRAHESVLILPPDKPVRRFLSRVPSPRQRMTGRIGRPPSDIPPAIYHRAPAYPRPQFVGAERIVLLNAICGRPAEFIEP